MPAKAPDFQIKVAETDAEIEAAQRLRYRVFVEELGADGPGVNHALTLEADRFDAHADHLLLIDRTQSFNSGVIGTYRLLLEAGRSGAGGFYTAEEFDMAPLLASGRRLLELGRSCLLAEYRGGSAMFELWAGLGRYVLERDIDVLFGVASFHGTDPQRHKIPLSFLHHQHVVAPDLRVAARGADAISMNLTPFAEIDRRAALLALPPLIKAYLRVGGGVGQGAWIDRAFNTIDVCMILDVAQMSARHRALYSSAGVDA